MLALRFKKSQIRVLTLSESWIDMDLAFGAGVSAGVGFAIPMATVERAVGQIIQYGKIIRPALNVQVTILQH